MEEKQYGTTWFSIYIVLFVIRVISTVLSAITVLVACINGGSANTFALPALIILLAECAFEVFTFVHLFNRTEFGYTINMVYIFASTFIAAFNVFFRRVLDDGFDAAQLTGILIACGFYLVVWSVPNFIYFKHRKSLFHGTLKENNMGTHIHREKSADSDAASKKTTSTPVVKMDPVTSAETVIREDDEKQIVSEAIKSDNADRPATDSKERIYTENPIPVKELMLLKELHDSGVLSDEEFQEKKKKLLNI